MSNSNNGTQRVVITGIGTINSLGHNVGDTWQKIVAGKSGIGPLTQYDTAQTKTKIGGEIRDFDAVACFGHREARRMDRYSQIAVVATIEAWQQSGNRVTPDNQYDIAVLLSTTLGGGATISEAFEIIFKQGVDKLRPIQLPMALSNIASAQVAMHFGIKGINFAISSACATSSHSIGEGAEIIKRGDANIAIVGGSESTLQAFEIGGFNAMHACSTRNDDPEGASRPFDATRDGFVPSEAAAVLVLESLDHAQARGATILAELVGYGATCDAVHVSAPDTEGDAAAAALRRAMKKAGVTPDQISYINAHGTSTKLNDATETKVLKKVFGDLAYQIPISSTKSMTGHAMSASGALEAIFSVMAIRDSVIPPTINYSTPDPECDLDYVPNQARKAELEYVLSPSYAFGGHNSALLFKKYNGSIV
jgi:3-oxoacyl-[acyl-carrier-protein] synthase II